MKIIGWKGDEIYPMLAYVLFVTLVTSLVVHFYISDYMMLDFFFKFEVSILLHVIIFKYYCIF